MQIALVSLFPDMFDAVSEHGVTGRAIRDGIVAVSHSNPRDYTVDTHRTVDDRPYGGGPGMLMKIDPLQQAIAAARELAGADARVVYLSPQGQRFDHAKAMEMARDAVSKGQPYELVLSDVHMPDMLESGAFTGVSRWCHTQREYRGAEFLTLYDVGIEGVDTAVERSAAVMPGLTAAGRKHVCHVGALTVTLTRSR